MNSDKEFTDEANAAPESHTSAKKSRIPRKIFWHPAAPEKETFRTVVVNYHIGSRNRGNMVMPKKRGDNWNHLISALNAKKERQSEDEGVYNLHGLYQLSLDELNTAKSITSSTVCEPQTSAIAQLCNQNKVPNDEHHQNIKVGIYKMPSLQSTSEDYTRNYISKLNSGQPINVIRSDCSKMEKLPHGCKTIKNEPAPPNVKVEIFNIPPIQEGKTEIINHKLGHALSQDADVIVISDDDDDVESPISKPELPVTTAAEVKPEIIHALQKLAEAAQSTCELCASTTKSTQKPEGRFEIPTQTVQNVLTEQKLIQIPSLIKPTQKSKMPTLKQRQLELHRLRVRVEQKRLELLEIKIQREQDEMARETILFEKELESKRKISLKNFNDENDA